MKNNTVIKLTKPVVIYIDEVMQTWDVGEMFIFRKSEDKRHGDGTYPDRIISLTDGSMIAWGVVSQMNKYSKDKMFVEVTL